LLQAGSWVRNLWSHTESCCQTVAEVAAAAVADVAAVAIADVVAASAVAVDDVAAASAVAVADVAAVFEQSNCCQPSSLIRKPIPAVYYSK